MHSSHGGIQARGLRKRFGATVALDGADLDVPAGRIVGVLGANGVGKTTLLRILATVLRADAGEAWVGGCDAARDPDGVRRSIGVAFVNERGLYWRLSAEHNLRFFARVAGLGRATARDRARALLDAVGLEGVDARPVATFSAGQRQRLILARALLAEPRVVMLDEPLRGIDEEGALLVQDLLRGHAEAGAAVLLTAPTAVELLGICDEIHRLRDGLVAPADLEVGVSP